MLHMKQIQLKDKTITLVETAHVSKQSVIDVQDAVATIKPDAICIELDENRASRIDTPTDYSQMKLIDVIREKKLILVIVNYILGQYQKKMASNMDSNVGDEMRAGIKAAHQLDVDLVMIDRDIQITFKRIWSHLSVIEKAKLLLSFGSADDVELSAQDIEDLKRQDVLNEALSQVSSQFPNIHKILVDERDQYMAQSIKNAPGKNILVIIGAAHSSGITKYLHQDDIDLGALEIILPPSKLSRIMKWLLPISFILLILVAFGFNMDGLSKLGSWMLNVSIASAIGAALCLAHPITILVSFLTAFISAIHPLLSVGWFAGLSEAYFRAPTVGDFETLNDDVKSIKKVLQNNILRTLLVMFMTSLFSVSVTLYFSVDSIRNFIQGLL